MNRHNRLQGAPLLGCLAVLFLAIPAVAHPWGYWHWARYGAPTITISNVARFAEEAEAARIDWDSHTILSLPAVAGPGADIIVTDGPFGDTGWCGIADITIQGYHITGGTARYNTSCRFGRTDRQAVFCQELGHLFGLDHSPYGCMGFSYFDEASSTTVQHNWDDIFAMYHAPHNECGSTGACISAGTCYVECCNRQQSVLYTESQDQCATLAACGAQCGVRNRLFRPQGAAAAVWLFGPDTNHFCETTAVTTACTPPGTCYIECCSPHGLFDVTHQPGKAYCQEREPCSNNGGVRNRLLLPDGSPGPADWFFHNPNC